MNSLFYKDLILLKRSKVLLYLLVFTCICCIISIKLPTMGITYMIFLFFLIYNSISYFEDKFDGITIIGSITQIDSKLWLAKYLLNTCYVITIALFTGILTFLNLFQLNTIDIILSMIFMQLLVFFCTISSYKKNQYLFIVTLVLSVFATTIITLIKTIEISLSIPFIILTIYVILVMIGTLLIHLLHQNKN